MPAACVVFGGSGFLGGALARRLAADGMRTLSVDLAPPAEAVPGVRYLTADIRDGSALTRLASDCPAGAWVVNLAARQYGQTVPKVGRLDWFCSVNVGGAVNVCRFAAASGAAGLVFLSTDMVYGLPRSAPVTEEHPLSPLGEYGTSKKRMEETVRPMARGHGLSLTVVRPRLIVGRGRLGVFVKLFRLLRRGLPVPLIGSGRNFYQMVAVEDCADAVSRILAAGCPDTVYNLGSRPELPVRDLVRALARTVGSRSAVMPLPAALVRWGVRTASLFGAELLYPEQYLLADKEFIAATGKAERELGWRSSRGDLEMMVAAYRHWESIS